MDKSRRVFCHALTDRLPTVSTCRQTPGAVQDFTFQVCLTGSLVFTYLYIHRLTNALFILKRHFQYAKIFSRRKCQIDLMSQQACLSGLILGLCTLIFCVLPSDNHENTLQKPCLSLIVGQTKLDLIFPFQIKGIVEHEHSQACTVII